MKDPIVDKTPAPFWSNIFIFALIDLLELTREVNIFYAVSIFSYFFGEMISPNFPHATVFMTSHKDFIVVSSTAFKSFTRVFGLDLQIEQITYLCFLMRLSDMVARSN